MEEARVEEAGAEGTQGQEEAGVEGMVGSAGSRGRSGGGRDRGVTGRRVGVEGQGRRIQGQGRQGDGGSEPAALSPPAATASCGKEGMPPGAARPPLLCPPGSSQCRLGEARDPLAPPRPPVPSRPPYCHCGPASLLVLSAPPLP